MRKLYTLLLGLVWVGILTSQTVSITGIIDADCPSANQVKAVVLHVSGAVDLSGYTLEKQNNSNTNWGSSTSLSSFGSQTNTFLYLVRNTAAFSLDFPSVDESKVLLAAGLTIFNGDDRVRLLDPSSNVADQYGASGVDGTGEQWEYTDSYAVRQTGTSASGSFVVTDWNFFAPNTLDGLGVCRGASPIENVVDFTSFLSVLEVVPEIPKPLLVIDDNQNLSVQNLDVMHLTVYNLKGQIVQEAKGDSVGVAKLGKGIYVAQITTSRGQILRARFANK